MTNTAIKRPRILLGVGAVALVFIPVFAKLIFYPAFPGTDDSFIHIAIAEHILDGKGWGVAGYRVNLSSSPVFTVLLLAVFAVGSIGLAQILTAVFSCMAMAVTFFATRSITGSNNCGIIALVVAAANPYLWEWTGAVMETSLAYLAVTVIAMVTLRLIKAGSGSALNFLLLGFLIGLGMQVRFEIGIFLPLSLVALWLAFRPGPRSVAALVGGVFLALLPWAIFAVFYFGTPIPTTFYALGSGRQAGQVLNMSVLKVVGAVLATGFGISILIAATAAVIASRSPEGLRRLRSCSIPLLFLLGWPIVLFGYYYVTVNGWSTVARYFVPGMATWPIALGLIISAVPGRPSYRPWLAAAMVACLTLALGITATKIQPALASFNAGYRAVNSEGAKYLQSNCKPGDVALLKNDIGIMARDGIGDCTLVDGAGLATPDMIGLSFLEQLSRAKPTFVVFACERSHNESGGKYPQLTLELSKTFMNPSIAEFGRECYFNIYRVNSSFTE